MPKGFVLDIPMKMLEKLGEADTKIEQLATTSENASKRIVDAFTQINTQGLQAFVNHLREANRAMGNISNSSIAANTTNISNAYASAADSVNQLVLSLSKMNNITISNNFLAGKSDYERMIHMYEKMFDEIENKRRKNELSAERSAEREIEANRRRAQQVIDSYNRELEQARRTHRERQRMYEQLFSQRSPNELIASQGTAKTLTELKTYANELKRALANLDPKSKEWQKLNEIYKQTNREIKNINNSMKDVEGKQKSLINTADQLKRAFALMFSVSAISGYVRQLMRVRGEFELQQRSLQAILQNKDEANRIWEQTIDLAVRSPFQVKQLVTYTKQLAAYRVESDKLFETTKMLADVSAGLGVDMQRLILAFGQVKAANYLRGTELRQFSEAGINILGELAKYFTELEGRAISVGEVFERVSKRMVAFADVEEIFKRITSEGGLFYNMQEIQAETLKGQISNLRDAIDIMFNEIGLESEGALKGSVSALRELVQNWREVAWWLKRIIPIMGAYKIANIAVKAANAGFGESLVNVLFNLTAFVQKMGIGGKTLESFGLKLASLGKFATAGVAGALIAIGIGIFEIWRRSTKASRELKRLNKELDKIFTEDKTSVDKQIKNFDNLVNRLKLVNKGSKEHSDIINRLNQDYGEYLGYIVNENTTYEKLKSSIDSVNQALVNKAKLATYEKAYGKVLESTNERINEVQKYLTTSFEKMSMYKGNVRIALNKKEINDIFYWYEKKVKETGEYGVDVFRDVLKEYGGFEGFVTPQGSEITKIEEYGKAIIEQKEKEDELTQRINNTYGQGIALTAEHRAEMERLKKDEEAALQSTTSRIEKDKIRFEFAKKRLELEGKYQKLDKSVVDKNVADLEKRSATVLDVNNKIIAATKELGDKYANMIYIDTTQAEKSIGEIAKEAAGSYEMQTEIINEQNALKKAGTVYDKDKLENAEKSAKAYEYLLKLLGRQDLLESKKGRGKDEVAERLRNQINLIKEMNKEYEKLRKNIPEPERTNRIRKSFESTAKGMGLDISNMQFNDTGVIAAFDALITQSHARLKNEINKAKDNFVVELDIRTQEERLEKEVRKIEEYFAQYDLSKELDKLGIGQEFAEKFFGFEYLSLDELVQSVGQSENLFKAFGDDGIKEWKKFSDKVTEIERKAQEERLKTYLQYARNSVGERAKIKLEELRKLQEIESTFTKPEQADEKEAAQKAVKEESYQAAQKLEWEEFQKTDTFINLFKDLDSASENLINHSIKKLKDFKDQWKNMPLEDMRSIVNKLNELENALVNINPFRAARDLRDDGYGKEGALADLQKQAISKEYLLHTTEQEISMRETLLRLQQEGNWADAERLASEHEYTDVLEDDIDTQKDTLDQKRSASDLLRKDLINIAQRQTGEKALAKSYEAQADAIGKAKDIADDLLGVFTDLAKTLGASDDSVGMIFAEMGTNIMDSVINTIMLQMQLKAAQEAAQGFAKAMNTAMGVVGWIVMGVQAITSIFSAIFKAHDNRLEAQIEEMEKSVERLQKEFTKLDEAIDEAYSTTALEKNTQLAEKNMKMQISYLESMIALEEDKKDSDTERIEQLQEDIESLKENYEDLVNNAFSKATDGILDNTLSVARGFVDAWYDAFAETGDGMKGLEENFEEMLLNMLKQQAAMTLVSPFIENMTKELKSYIDPEKGDAELTVDEAKEWVKGVLEDLPIVAENLENYFDAFDSIIGSIGGDGSLSGLEQGIAGASEETIQVLAAYANSCRGFLASIDSKLNEVATRVFNNEDNENPILSQLRIVAQQTSAINSLLSSLTKSGHSEGGMGLKVFIN